MSNKALTWAFEADLPMAQKFVLVALADKADEAHSCFPGQKVIAQMVGSTDRTVRRALVELEAAGFIVRQERRATDGYRTSDRYFLAVEGALPDKLAGSAHRTSATVSPDIHDSLTGQSVRAIEPSANPKKNPQSESARGSRVPEPFEVTEKMRKWAAENTPAVDIEKATEEFVDYWRGVPGARGRKSDWVGTWRNDMRTKQKFAVRDGWKPAPLAAVRDVDADLQARQKAEWCAAHGITVEAWDAMSPEEQHRFVNQIVGAA